jgi:hypothetical protein
MVRTLWLSEDALLNTSSESSVEQGVKHGIGRGDLVVVPNILLEGGTAENSQRAITVNMRRVDYLTSTSRAGDGEVAYLDPLRWKRAVSYKLIESGEINIRP